MKASVNFGYRDGRPTGFLPLCVGLAAAGRRCRRLNDDLAVAIDGDASDVEAGGTHGFHRRRHAALPERSGPASHVVGHPLAGSWTLALRAGFGLRIAARFLRKRSRSLRSCSFSWARSSMLPRARAIAVPMIVPRSSTISTSAHIFSLT